MLPAPVSPVNNRMLDGTSTSIIPPYHQDDYYTRPSLSPDQQEQSRNKVDQSNDANKKTRKFLCQHCGRKFLRAEHLRRHEITRTLTQMGELNQ